MTRYKFIKKNYLRYAAAVMTSIYIGTMATPQIVNAITTSNSIESLVRESTVSDTITYTKNYELASDLDGYSVVLGTPNKLSVEAGVLKLANQQWTEARIVDNNSPALANAEYEFDFKLSPSGQFGAIIRYVDSSNYGMICYDGGWVLQSGSDWKTISTAKPITFEANRSYRMKIRYMGENIVLSVDGNEIFNIKASDTTIRNFPVAAGKIGFRAWSSPKEVQIDNLSYKEIKEAPKPLGREITVENTDAISSSLMQVKIDKLFPNVVSYNIGEKSINGSKLSQDAVSINNIKYTPNVVYTKTADNKGTYSFSFSEISLKFDITLEVIDNYVELKLTNVNEGDFTLKTLEFLDHNLVTVDTRDSKANLTVAKVTGTNTSQDIYLDLPTATVDSAAQNATIAIINNNNLAVAIENNIIDYSAQVKYQTKDIGGQKTFALWNSSMIYREVEKTLGSPINNGNLYSKIIVSEDRNNDNEINWQDGAIGYRKLATKPQFSDMVKQNVSHVAMNFASQAQYPFERIVDQVAEYSNIIDGFGQMLLIKGYQSEGHDSGHPDYGNNFNERAGGVEAFNDMTNVLEEKYKTKVGVHINATEAYPEAKYFSNKLVGTNWQGAWAWLDNSYAINKRADILNNDADGVQGRIDELKANAPGIDWIYVDTYWSNPWDEYKMQEYLLKNNFAVTTEYSGPFRQNSIWTHWANMAQGSGEYKKGTRSSIVRFIENETKDVFPTDIHLKGTKHDGFSGWQTEKSLDKAVNSFYTWEVPTKYMQNFAILKETKAEVTFENNLVSKVANRVDNSEGIGTEGDQQILKDGNLIYSAHTYNGGNSSRDNRVFIPWGTDVKNPDKIYAWNDFSELKEWSLPLTWSGATEVYLYKTDSTGRSLVETIPVIEGKVQLQLKSKTPYVVYKNKVENTTTKTEWSETSLIRDNGFNAFDFKDSDTDTYGWWKPASTSGDITNIKFEKDTALASGQSYLRIDGKNDGEVSQNLIIEGGKHYSASVWAEISDKSEKPAEIEVILPNGDKVNNKISLTTFTNGMVNTDKNGTRFQRLKVDFYMPEGSTNVTLKLKAGIGKEDTSYVRFDNARIVEEKKSTLEIENEKLHYFYENFESVDEGWGPFTDAANGESYTHLSEKHEGYTTDTIDGQFSFKVQESTSGVGVRSVPGMLKLNPNTKYKVKFDYKYMSASSNFDVVVGTNAGGKAGERMWSTIPMQEGDKGTFEGVFQTGAFDDYYVGFARTAGTLVVDNFIIDSYTGEVPEYKPAGVDPLMVNPETIKISASSEETSSENTPAKNATDGDVSTFWHSRYSGTAAPKPHYLTLELPEATIINKVRYVPRAGGGNGTITGYKILTSMDGINFVEAKVGTLENTAVAKLIEIPSVTAKFVKLEVTTSVGGFASAAEVNVYIDKAAIEATKLGEATISVNKETLLEGDTANLSIAGKLVNGSDADLTNATIKYIVANEDIVSINNGVITALKEGTSEVSAVVTLEGKEVTTNKLTITVNKKAIENIVVAKVNNLTATNITTTTVDLNWDDPISTVGLVEYAIYKDGKLFDTVKVGENKYTVTNLRVNTIYGFKIVARYSNNQQSKPQSINIRTKQVSSTNLLF